MSKHNLRSRPVYHHQRDAIDAHLTVVMTAQTVTRYLQETIEISITRIVRKLRGLQEITIGLNSQHLTVAPGLTDTAKNILAALNIPPQARKT
mgnify:FL=1|jgi:tnpB family transposase